MKRLLPFVFLILLFLGAFYALFYFFQPERHRQEISSALTTLLKRPVVVGPLSFSYLPPALRIDQLAVMNNDGTPMLQVGTASVPLDWNALVHLKLAPREIELSQWRLDIERRADGGWDIEDFWPGTTGLAGAPAWPLQEVKWKEGEIHWIDKFAAVPRDLTLSSVVGHWEPRPRTLDTQGTFTSVVVTGPTRLSFTAKGQFFASPQWAGDLSLSDPTNTATFHLSKSPTAIDVKGQSARWRLANALAFFKFYARGDPSSAELLDPSNQSNCGPTASCMGAPSITLETWQFHANLQKGRLTFDHSAGIGGGASEAKGEISKVSASPILAAEFAAKDVPAAVMWELTGQKVPLVGKVTLLVKGFQMAISTGAAASVACVGSLELHDGYYPIPVTSVTKLSRAKTMTYLKLKFPDFATVGVPVAKFSARWTAKNGIATVDSARLVSTDIKAGWTGKVDIAKEGLDGTLRLEVHEKNPKLARLVPLKYHTQPAFGRLQGTVSDWHLRALPAGKIPAAVAAKLSRAINGK